MPATARLPNVDTDARLHDSDCSGQRCRALIDPRRQPPAPRVPARCSPVSPAPVRRARAPVAMPPSDVADQVAPRH